MKNLRTVLALLALTAGFAACSDSSAPLTPGAPRFDGGLTDTTTVTTTTETTSDSTTVTERGGHTYGSGN